MLGQDAHSRRSREKRSEWLRQRHDYREVTGGLYLHIAVEVSEHRIPVEPRRLDRLDREQHILSVQWFAVVPEESGLQLENIGQAVLGDVGKVRKIGLDAALRAESYQAGEHEA